MDTSNREHLRRTIELYRSKLNEIMAKLKPYEHLISEKERIEGILLQLEQDFKVDYTISEHSSQLSISLEEKPFRGLNTPDAIIKYLTSVQEMKTVKDLQTALLEGGIQTESTNYYMVVASALKRELKKKSPRLYKSGTKYGLLKWKTIA